MKNKFLKYRKTVKGIANEIEEKRKISYISFHETNVLMFDLIKEKIIDKCCFSSQEERGEIWIRIDLILINLLEKKGIL